ncbi:MAG: hypothetical protein J6X66_07145, partial [Lachnospiraceae bacterium]|nr:hypothetical protein [Lachnospiraceae bacterium]
MDNKELLKKQIGGQAVINTQKQSQAQVNMTAPVMQMPLEQQKQNNNVQKQKEQVADPIHKGQELEWAKFSDVGDFVNVETDDLLYLKQVVEDFLPEALNKNSSFAMKLVGERMQELSRVLADRSMTEEEKEANTAFVLDNLCKVCIRYKKAKFKSGIKPKNKRHKTVAMINNLADAAYKKLKGKELSLHNKNIRDQKDILDHMGGSRLKAVRAEIKSLDNFLNTEIPLNEEKLKKARNDMLNNGFGELLERFNQYLESHISFSRENEERFRYAYKVYDQYRLQQKYLESLDYDTIYRLKKAGVKTWKELISRDAKEILEPKKVEETVREEKQECTEEVKASLLAAAFGSEAYKKFVKTEKDGKTVYVSEEKKLLTKAEMVEQAKADKLIIQYSTQALLQTNEVQILDMLMGVEKREETDFRYDVERTVFKGKEVLMIKGIKAVSTGAAFNEKRPGKDFMLPVYHFGIEDRVLAGITKELKAGRDKLKDFVSNLQPAEIVTKLKENGTELNEAQTEALNERISVLKQRYAEAKYSADNKYAYKDLIADVERDYKTSRILANAKANAYRNVKTQEDIDSMTGSGKKMLEAKKKIATTFLGAKSKNRKTLEKAGKDGEADIVSRLYKNIEEYSAIQDTAEDKRINKLLEAERKKAAGEGGDKPTGMEALERETELLSQILKLTGEYEKLIEDKLQLSNEELENDEYSFTNEDSALEQAIKQKADAKVRTKGGIRNYLWKREKAKVEELKKQFSFHKGVRHFGQDM